MMNFLIATKWRASLLSALAVVAMVVTTPAEAASKREKAERLVAKAADTTAYFADDSAFETMWELADDAKAMVIVPRSLRGGFVFGASGGNAVMLARNEDKSWSEPTFFTIGSISFGLQAGGEASEMILLVMTQRGMEHLLSTSVKLGGDISIAAGPIGAGAKAQTTDILAFARSRGLYGGISLEGEILKTRRSWNNAYYGADVTPADIIYRERVYNPSSAKLQNAAWTLAHKDEPASLAPLQPSRTEPAVDGAATQGEQQSEVIYEDDAVYGAPLTDPVENPNDPN